MSESRFWKYLSKGIKHRGHFNRIESHGLSVGFPDVEYFMSGYGSVIELKFGADEVPEIRPSQVRWFRQRIKQGGKPWVFAHIMIKGTNHYLLFKGEQIRTLCESEDLSEWFALSYMSWTGKINWDSLTKALSKPYVR